MNDIRELLARAANDYGFRANLAFLGKDEAFGTADAILAALKANNLVTVPREPTEAMIAAGRCPPVDINSLALEANQANAGRYGTDSPVTIAYRAMLAASPYWSK